MARVLIIGYGNPLRGDDGLGWHAAEALRGTPGAEVITVHQLTPELADDISRAELAIFLDAASDGGAPGEWRRQTVDSGSGGPAAFTHHATPAGLVAAAQLLYGGAPLALLFTMTGAGFDLREGLSECVAAALPAMVAAVRDAAGAA